MTYSRWIIALCLGGLVGASAWGQASPSDLASMREDINGLSQRLADLSLRVEQLENAQQAGRDQPRSPRDLVSKAQFDDAIARLSSQVDELRTALAAASAADATDLANAPAPKPKAVAGDRSAAGRSAEGRRPAGKTPAFSTNFPKEGLTYTVQKGDTVASIAKKTSAKFSDIVNANQLADPSLIHIGQTLFIPGGK